MKSVADGFCLSANGAARRDLRFGVLVALAWVAIGMSTAPVANAQVNVTTIQNDIGRTGQNLNETILNTSNVNATQFGKLFSQQVDGLIYAQPLYLSGITINGATHNVVFVATEHDSVYAFDADNSSGTNSSPLWQASMLSTAHGAAAGATTIPQTSYADIIPEYGITGTPVIDPSAQTLYVVSATLEGGTEVQRLHALDVTTGAEKFGGPVKITASVPGTGSGSVGGTLTLTTAKSNQRPGLLLLNGIVYVGYASHEDGTPWHGWLLAYNATTLAQISVFSTTPNGNGAGIWMSGAGLAADQLDPTGHPYGRMFLVTGNGDYNATKPYTSSQSYSESHLNLDLTNGVPTVTDLFTTKDQAAYSAGDKDVGSGGVLVLPTQAGPYPNLLVQGSKDGVIYLLNRENMGGYNTTADQVVQEISGLPGFFSSPAYWNGRVFTFAQNDNLKSYPLVNGLLGTPTRANEQYGYPGATPAISANGTAQGICWTINSAAYTNGGPSILQAHDASNVVTLLYSSTTNPTRDVAGPAVKFTIPTIANGKVYVGTANQVDVYGLLSGATQASVPAFTPGPQSFTGSLSVTIADASPNASIYYTVDGTAATTSSSLYAGPISVTSTQTLNAIATAPGLQPSSQTTATYTQTPVATPTFSPASGTYTAVQSVTISDATAGSTIYYTTNGTTPTTASSVYTGPISVGTTQTVKAMATAAGYAASAIASATYNIQLPAAATPTFSPAAGTYSTTQSVTISDATAGSTFYYTTNGTTPTTASAVYSAPISVSTTQTVKAIATASGYSTSAVRSATYTIQLPAAATPTFSPAAGTYGNAQSVTISDATAGSTIYYTTDGTTPTTASAVYSAPINVSTTQTVKAIAIASGYSTSAVGSAAYTIGQPTAATPTFSPAAGTYGTPQSVTISDATAASTIYYTTDGTTPTTASAVYSAPISVNTTQTLKAMATAAGYKASAVASATYTIGTQAAAPAFSPPGGSYTSAQTVTLSSTTPGTSIFYTTDGTTPATTAGGSTSLYSSPITVSTSTTIKAIATASGYTASTVSSAIYTITPGASSTINFSGGFTSGGMVFNSKASLSGSRLRITDGGTAEATSAWYNTQVSTATFSTDFSFQLTPGTASIADGFCFVLQSNTTAAVGGVGGGLGYGPNPGNSADTSKIPNSVAIKFDLYGNVYGSGGEGPNSTGIYTNGATPTVPSVDLRNTAIDLHSGHVFNVHMSYDGANLSMTITDAATNGSFTQTWPITLSTYVGSSAYVGFTGATGGQTAVQEIITWTFTSSASTTPVAATPTFSPAAGTYGTTQSVTISDATAGSTIYYTTDGTTPTTASAVYSTPISVSTSQTLKAIATASGYSTSAVGSATYTIGTPAAATPTFNPPAGTYSAVQSVTITDATAGSTIYYTTDGTTPTMASAVYSAPISVSTSQTVKALATASGYTTSPIGSATYTIQLPTATTPTFSPAAGSYGTAQSVTISDATAGSTIYYTTDGTTPTTASAVYSASINVSTSQTAKAIATASGYNTSAVGSAAYTIGTQAAAPSFSPPGGSYASAQTVTLSSPTAGASIFYTTDGTAPATSAGGSTSLYSGPITVSTSTTIKAIATATGYTASSVSSAAYTIAAGATSAINFSGGFGSGGLVFNGKAKLNGSRLRVTDGGTGEASSAWYDTQVSTATFSNDFSFQLTPGTSPIADGFCFVLQSNNTAAVGGMGGGLGYGPNPGNTADTSRIPNSVAIKFDLYSNVYGSGGEGPDSIGIYTNGATPTIPAVDMRNTGIDLHSGHVFNVHMTYDGANLAMTITDATTNVSFTQTWPITLSTYLGGAAYVGFTGGTGGLTAVQEISTWTFTGK